jgi:hypothetical protein
MQSNQPLLFTALTKEVTEKDEIVFRQITDTQLTPDQQCRIANPARIYPQQNAVLATHFHPEQVPLELIHKRIERMFPNSLSELLIPTQHNELLCFKGYAGVEVDCYAKCFNRKVQLLAHFQEDRVTSATVFREMLSHTFRYRANQLSELVETIVSPVYEERLQQAVLEAGADDDLVRLVQVLTKKFKYLLEHYENEIPINIRKNKLLRDFFNTFRASIPPGVINHAQALIKAAKGIMKQHFSPKYFYRVEELIEEVRLLNGGIVVPHPEQFWPILLAEYDVDGYEVWNPQSREFTEFLINVVIRQNKSRKRNAQPLLIFMGDDTHMGEKLKPVADQDITKASREIGYQPPWEDSVIRNSLIVSNASRQSTIEAYRERLAS